MSTRNNKFLIPSYNSFKESLNIDAEIARGRYATVCGGYRHRRVYCPACYVKRYSVEKKMMVDDVVYYARARNFNIVSALSHWDNIVAVMIRTADYALKDHSRVLRSTADLKDSFAFVTTVSEYAGVSMFLPDTVPGPGSDGYRFDKYDYTYN